MPAIISFLLLLSGLIGMIIGQRMIKNRYDFFFRQIQPEDAVAGRTVFICGTNGSFHKKEILDVLVFGNGWKAFETDDGNQHVLEECFVKEEGNMGTSMSGETRGKWISRQELDQYKKTFETPVWQLENNTDKKEEK